jgi:hypothetical protein
MNRTASHAGGPGHARDQTRHLAAAHAHHGERDQTRHLAAAHAHHGERDHTRTLVHAHAHHGERGQAAIELLVVLPLVLAGALAGGAILAAIAAQDRADDAARAGAMALLQDGDPAAAARDLLPPRDRDGVTVRGRRVTVTLEPRLPLHLTLPGLRVRSTADAGPAVRP